MRPDIYRATLKRVKFLRYRKPESLLEQLGTIPGSYTFASTLDGRRDQSPGRLIMAKPCSHQSAQVVCKS